LQQNLQSEVIPRAEELPWISCSGLPSKKEQIFHAPGHFRALVSARSVLPIPQIVLLVSGRFCSGEHDTEIPARPWGSYRSFAIHAASFSHVRVQISTPWLEEVGHRKQ
jgi:hypothetical protein